MKDSVTNRWTFESVIMLVLVYKCLLPILTRTLKRLRGVKDRLHIKTRKPSETLIEAELGGAPVSTVLTCMISLQELDSLPCQAGCALLS